MAFGKDPVINPIPLQAEPASTPSWRALLRSGRGGEAIGWLLLVLAVVAVLMVGTSPAPYSLELPGSTADTLGTAVLADGDEVELITIDGAEVYPSDGQLDLVTVGVLGSPERPITWLDVLGAWFRPGSTAVPMEQLYPEGSTSDEVAAEGAAQMELSQREAVAAALTELDIPFESVVLIHTVVDDGPAAGLLEDGDVLLSVSGEPVTSTTHLRELLDAHGTTSPAEFVVQRGDDEVSVEITPEPLASEGDRPVIGVLVTADFDFPFDVTIQLENVGGPSAGLMFALGIYDRLTPGALPEGEHIAGTGTIDADGAVGEIGGVRQKMHAAMRDGAEWFLVPVGNCAEAVAAAPAGLRLIPVASLDEAITVVDTIAEIGAESPDSGASSPAIAQELPSCSA